MEEKPQIAFLLYANRSGSTFLASSLANVPQVGVTIEGTFIARLVEKNKTILGDADVEAVMGCLIADLSFGDWSIDQDRLRRLLIALPKPAGVEDVIRSILEIYFNNNSIKYYIVKAPRMYLHVNRIRRQFGSPKFIHILRDPRAIYASQLRSRSSTMNLPMTNDPVMFAFRWRRRVHKLEREVGGDFLEIRYEDLIGDHKHTIAKACSFLTISNSKVSAFQLNGHENRYYDRIPENQRHLHSHVKDGVPLRHRVDGWQKELNETDIHIIQLIAFKQMNRLGYDLSLVSPSASRGWRVFFRALFWRFVATSHAARRYLFYIYSPSHLKEAFFRSYYKYKGS